ncbi:beta-ketoacyl-[acyl-carrier-protein] synthase family protein [Streptomyces otsuchiensis]|uniref:beta-ketoacyl-[acyl-carrier-protein] synthase family protein n=1 Tax=Streptomyces otsuchiensis TaxID=2681388 RepID=UPI001030BB6A|nr:beta-ketoacyl-[acyl-carrier-protein] synthase family protein [Streptomyces otsuchiensis]
MSTAPDDVLVTGYGLLTGHGAGDAALRDGVFAGNAAFRPVDRFATGRFRSRTAATARELPSAPGTRENPGPPDQRAALVACARAALGMAGLEEPRHADVLLGTQGDHTGVTAFWSGGGSAAVPGIAESLPAALTGLVADDLGVSGRRLAFVNACVASTNALVHGARLIRAGRAGIVLCGGAYLVEPEFFAKFDSGRAFAADGRVRPFSAERQGLLLGDGAAVLVLESGSGARARGAQPLARLSGWGMAADAHHVCHPHPEGTGMARAISAALRDAGAAPEGVDYVNAHGTGTKINDPAETSALHRALGPAARHIPVSSTKSTTGHMLEGSGAVEAVIGVYALLHGILPPTAGYGSPDPVCDLDWVPNEPRSAAVRRVLSVNAAFGGLNAAIVLERP